MVKIENLSVAFDGAEVVKNITIEIADGEIVGVVGESGSGKSVTALTLMGLISEEDAIKAAGGNMNGDRITEYRVQSLARNSAKGSEATIYTEEDLKKLPIASDEPEDDDI